MTLRSDLPKVKPEENPSILNHNAGKGAFLGAFAGNVAGTVAVLTGRSQNVLHALTYGGLAVGGILGGLSGKKTSEKELDTGRTVKNPGYFNKGILSGMVASSVLHSPYVLLKKTPNTLLSLAIGIGAICWGSISRKNELQRDFDRAVGMRDAEINTLKASVAAPQPAPAPSYKDSVTAEESARLAAKQERQHRMTDAVAAQPAPESTYQRA